MLLWILKTVFTFLLFQVSRVDFLKRRGQLTSLLNRTISPFHWTRCWCVLVLTSCFSVLRIVSPCVLLIHWQHVFSWTGLFIDYWHSVPLRLFNDIPDVFRWLNKELLIRCGYRMFPRDCVYSVKFIKVFHVGSCVLPCVTLQNSWLFTQLVS